MSVFNALHTGIYNKLAGGTALTALLSGGTASLYHIAPPDKATMPYVVWNIQGGGDDNLTAHRTKNMVVFVRGFSGDSAAAAGTIDKEADALLHGQVITVSGWSNNFWTAREMDFERAEVSPSGKRHWMAGGFYRIRLGEDE